jgi:hypothetical protein
MVAISGGKSGMLTTVIVKYRIPVPVEREDVLDAFQQAVVQFAGLPGLLRKYFCYDEPSHTCHSVYLWDDEELARAFYDRKFIISILEKFDATPEWVFLDCLLVVDNEKAAVGA